MFRKTTLQNGLRVVTQKLDGTKSVTVLVLVGAGSRYEKEDNRGISHFLEHMFFKGGDRYKNTKEVSEAIDSVGGEFNAFTGKEYAGYYVKVARESIDVACDVLSDMMINAKFPQKEIENERGVILEEYNLYQDTPMYQIGWNFENLVFGDQPLGWDQIGKKEVIRSVGHDDFVEYKKKLYTSDNTVIAVVGNIENDEAVEKIQKYFDLESKKKAYEFEPLKKLNGGRVNIKEKKTEQAHIAVGFPGCSERSKDHFVIRLLAVILGGNMSSRMFLEVREAKGLTYYIRTGTDNYIDGGTFVTNAGVDLKRVEEAIISIVEEYKKIGNEDVPASELTKAKEYLKGKMVLRLEDSEEYAHLLGKYELLHDQAKSPEEIMKLIDAVKVSDIRRVAEDVLKEEDMKLALIGPYEDKEKFEDLLKF
ncbi:hypothetical protein GF366_03305 [Candidatus Peregrinibacteria bacterium]|nr:hypothetical protein [Candidatus Peregrinibacteria bacterium]